MLGKRLAVLLAVLISFSLTACGNVSETTNTMKEQTLTETVIENMQVAEYGEPDTSDTQEDTVDVIVYYSNPMADGLDSEEMQLQGLSAQKLIGALAIHNIVSIDTKVLSFSTVEESGKQILRLDLSPAFSDYLCNMGTSGEKIIMAALTNTFLEAFKAEGLYLTVEGKALETGHTVYNEELTYFTFETTSEEKQIEKVDYEIVNEKYQSENGLIQIDYPQFSDMEDEDMKEAFNEILKNYVFGSLDEENLDNLTCNYEVTYEKDNIVSIVIRGIEQIKGVTSTTSFAAAYNFDLENGCTLQLKDFVDTAKVAERLLALDNSKILTDKITNEKALELMNQNYPELETSLRLFDYDSKAIVISWPLGYSYLTDTGVNILLGVPHADGDYLEIQLDNID